MNAAGIMPGIKVDTGAKPLAKAPGETVTEGLDGLRDRLDEYREIGAYLAGRKDRRRMMDDLAVAIGRFAKSLVQKS